MKIDAGKIPRVETSINIGEPKRIGKRTLHFLGKISIITTGDGDIIGGWANPIALVVIEGDIEYVLSFTGKDLTINQLMEMVPSLRDVLNKEDGIYKIKVE